MHAVSAASQRDIGTGVHQDARRARVGQRQRVTHQIAKIAGGEIFFANLDEVDAVLERARDGIEQRRGAAGGAAVGYVAAQHSEWRVIALARASAAEGEAVA